ncbi:LysR family transcriptional regulator [Marinomonas sp.]|uniref:LysR family transcriptional regulator n=1 Tax=Marinomonas sp. TaxID=1904862 RepID=UPI003BA9E760
MHFRKLDLNLLVALDALIRNQNVSLAAEELHLSQSAMSSSLSRLRRYFNDELLIQTGRKMMLSPLAEQLEQPIRDILVKIDASIMLKPGFDPTTSDREFRICVSDYMLHTLIPHVIDMAQAQGCTVKLNFLPQVSDPKKELDRGEADLLIMPDIFCSDFHLSEPLITDEFACVVWDQSDLAKGEMTMKTFVSSGHVCMQPPNSNPSFETHSYESQGISRRVDVRTFSFSCIPNLIVGTNLIATLQKRLIDKSIAQGMALKSFPTPVALPTLRESMQWHKYQNADLGIIWLRQLMLEAVAKHMC